jgi:hypothetical protein
MGFMPETDFKSYGTQPEGATEQETAVAPEKGEETKEEEKTEN